MNRDTEYMYASARIRAAEGKDTPAVRLERMLDCRTTEGLLATVLELGFLRDAQPAALQEAWDLALSEAAALVKEVAPEPEVYDFLFYKYDCNNIKTALKAGILGLDYSSNYYTCGTVNTTNLADRLANGDVSGLPDHMAKAVVEAMEAYARTDEGRQIDFYLDKGCYADMADNVAKYGVPLFQEYVAAKADFTNVLSSVRLSGRGRKESACAIFAEAFVPGGTMPIEQFCTPAEGCLGYAELSERLDSGVVKDAVNEIVNATTSENVRPEKVMDELTLSILNRERYTPFGVHVPAVFFLQREMELKNGRIIAAGLVSGLTGTTLRERIRVAYV